MTVRELKKRLNNYPNNMKVKLFPNHKILTEDGLVDFTEENIVSHAPDDHVSKNGNLIRGKEERVLVVNPPIL